MTVPIMTYTKVSGVAGAKGILSALNAFCTAKAGWTVKEYQTSVAWTAGGWIAGTEDFLEVVSSGYGSQVLTYRFRAQQHGTDPTTDWLWFVPVDPNNPNYQMISTHPIDQNDWQTNGDWRDINTPSGSMPNLWMFDWAGKMIILAIQMTSDSLAFIGFGTIELIPELQNTTELQFHYVGNDSDQLPEAYWYNTSTYFSKWYVPGVPATNARGWLWCYWRGAGRYNTEVNANVWPQQTGETADGNWGNLDRCIVYNSFTNKRVGQQQTVYVKDPTSGLWYVAGQQPFIYMETSGLAFGEQVNFGPDEYLCFPLTLVTKPYGVGFRIS